MTWFQARQIFDDFEHVWWIFGLVGQILLKLQNFHMSDNGALKFPCVSSILLLRFVFKKTWKMVTFGVKGLEME